MGRCPRKLAAFVLVALAAAGCASATPLPPGATVHTLDPSLAAGDRLAYFESIKRFDNPVVVGCHGGDDGVTWFARTRDEGDVPVPELAQRYHRLYPERVVVLWICNPGGRRLDTPGVYYFLTNAMIRPDGKPIGPGHSEGSIWDAVTGMK